MAAPKTWTQLETEIKETFRKWRRNPPDIINSLPRKSLQKRWHDSEERAVGVEFPWFAGSSGRVVKLKVKREERAQENLQLIATALEMIRMAEVRGVTDLIVALYRQMYPQSQQQAAPPPPRASVDSSGPYATLHISNAAPLEVAEAAWKAMIRLNHPDVGGSTVEAQKINAAIEQIRKEKVK